MKNRPALKFLFPFFAGILLGWYAPISFGFSIIAIACLLFISFYYFQKKNSPLYSLALFTLIFLFGILKISFDTRYASLNNIANFINPNREVTLIATIADQPNVRNNRIQFTAEVESLQFLTQKTEIDGEILVTILRTRSSTLQKEKEYLYGDKIILKGFLEQSQRARNPGEFDFAQYLRLKNITATFIVKKDSHIIRLHNEGNWLLHKAIFPARAWMSRQLDSFIGGKEGNFLKGLILGDRSEIDREAKEVFINAGVMHILAVSGSNVLFIVLIFSAVFTSLRFPKRLSYLALCLLLVAYIFLTGESASVIRAVIMGLIFLSANYFELAHDNYNTIAVAAVLILLVDAKELFDSGFQLSFAAVLSLAYFYPKIKSLIIFFPPWLHSLFGVKNMWLIFASTFAATLGTLPFTTMYFEKISLVGMITNLFIIPLSGLLLALGVTVIIVALFSSALASVYAVTATFITRIVLWLIQYAGNVPFASIDMRFSFWESLVFYGAVFLLCDSFSRQFIRRLIIVVFAIANIMLYRNVYAEIQSAQEKLRITFLDVGQGDAVHIHFPSGENMLIDTGPRTLTYDVGERVIVPYLKRQNISRLNAVVVSHPHSDHLGGLPSILRSIHIDTVYDAGTPISSELFSEYMFLLDSLRIPHRILRKGNSISQFNSVKIFVLHPSDAFADTSREHNLNNSSVVLKIIYGATSIFFPGDAEQKAEEEISNRYGDMLHSTVLKAGHHGSTTSTSLQYFTTIHPDNVVISVGARNTFRHPSKSTLAKFQKMNIPYHRTDEQGAVMFESDGATIQKIDWRSN
jgi:competence protein ComEC